MMYRWYSKALKNYGWGVIVVRAGSPEEARRLVRCQFPEYLKERYDYRFNPDGTLFDEDDQEWLTEKLKELEEDLANAVEEVSDVVFVPGSE